MSRTIHLSFYSRFQTFKKSIWVVFATLTFLLLAFPIAQAAGTEEKTMENCSNAFHKYSETIRKDLPKVMKDAKVTDEQQQRLTAIRQDTLAKIQPIAQMLFEKQKELIQAVYCPQPDTEQIRRLGREIGELRAKIINIKVDGLLQSKCILTPEQKAAIAAFMGKKMNELQSKYPECIPYFGCDLWD